MHNTISDLYLRVVEEAGAEGVDLRHIDEEVTNRYMNLVRSGKITTAEHHANIAHGIRAEVRTVRRKSNDVLLRNIEAIVLAVKSGENTIFLAGMEHMAFKVGNGVDKLFKFWTVEDLEAAIEARSVNRAKVEQKTNRFECAAVATIRHMIGQGHAFIGEFVADVDEVSEAAA